VLAVALLCAALPAAASPPLAPGKIVTAADGGGPVLVHRYAYGRPTTFNPFPSGFLGGVRVAMGDVNGDGFADIVVGAGPGGGPQVAVFSGLDGSLLSTFFAFSPAFTGGVNVAAADLNGDGKAEVVVGQASGGSTISVFNPLTAQLYGSFLAFPAAFTGGVRIATGDVDDDGTPDIVAGAGPGGGPSVKVFSGADGSLLASFFAFNPQSTVGVFVAAGDVNGDGHADLIVSPGQGGPPAVSVFSGADLSPLATFFAYPPAFTGGVRVAAGDVDGDHRADVITVPGPGGFAQVEAWKVGATATQVFSKLVFGQALTSGFFVGAVDADDDGAPEVAVSTDAGVSSVVQLLDDGFPAVQAADDHFKGGVRIATGDVTGDGVPDVVTTQGPKGQPFFYVFDGHTGELVNGCRAVPDNFKGGLEIALGDVNHDRKLDFVVGEGKGGNGHVRVFSGDDCHLLTDFAAFPGKYQPEVRVAAGDVDGDGYADVVVGSGGDARVVVYSGKTGELLSSFVAYTGKEKQGVWVAAGDVNGDERADIVVGPGSGGGDVEVFDGTTHTLLHHFSAYGAAFKGGTRVAVADLQGDGSPEIVTGPGPASHSSPTVKVFSLDGTPQFGFNAFEDAMHKGVLVAASSAH
jgi:hypothetical protein